MFDTNVLAHMQSHFLSYDNSGMGLFVSQSWLCLLPAFCRLDLASGTQEECSLTDCSFPPGNVAAGPGGCSANLHRPRRGKPSNAP